MASDLQYNDFKDSREIRLLTVHPRTDNVKYSIQHVHLLDPNRSSYETISYNWGPKPDRSVIIVSNGRVRIPNNAIRMLEHIRLEHENRVVWLDSVCINQKSLDERASQVAIIGNIFSGSTRNLIYLGEDDGSATRALRDVEILLQEIVEQTNNYETFRSETYAKPGTLRFSTTGLASEVDFDALTTLFTLPWFSRLWVLQEAALAPENICHYGGYRIALVKLLRAAVWLHYKSRFVPKRLRECWCPAKMWDLVDQELGHQTLKSGKIHEMGMLLPMAQTLLVTQSRDKIYAVLGLLSQADVPADLRSLLKPDYTKPLSAVYRDAAKFAILQHGTLSFLDDVCHRSDRNVDIRHFPSWVPQWHRSYKPQWDPIDFPGGYNACGSLLQPINSMDRLCLADPNRIRLTGIPYDDVWWVSEHITEATIQDSYQLGILIKTIVEKLQGHRELSRQRLSSLLSDLAMTLVVDRDMQQNKAGQDLLGTIRDYLDQLLRRSRQPDDPNLDKFLEKREKSFLPALSDACQVRRFFITESGVMGLGPRVTRPQDQLVILYGAEWPYLMRRTNDGHLLLGQAYAHGIMYGEAIRAQQRYSVLPAEEFEVI